MKQNIRKPFRVAIILAAIILFMSNCSINPVIRFYRDNLARYADSTAVKQIVFVMHHGEASDAHVVMYCRDGRRWRETLRCEGYVGKNGIGKLREGDGKTPRGDFGIIQTFGLKPDPGTSLPYFQVEDSHWCCTDSVAYNRIIDIRDCPHQCEGEHLIKYDPAYNYSIFLDYNKDCVIGAGSAIFFHCKSRRARGTAGCVAVDEDDMAGILRTLDINARIIIESEANLQVVQCHTLGRYHKKILNP